MKKLLMICLVIVLAAQLCVAAFATTGGFISSPSGKPAPELVEGTNTSEDCEAEIIVTSYADRNDLPEEARQKLEEAYAIIRGTQDLTTLNELLGQIAKERGVAVEDLAVSDLFDISSTDCDGHEAHGHFDITLEADTLSHFVALLHYYNNEWHVVDSAEVTNEGTHLEFDADQLSPFAIVLSTGDAPAEPEDDNTLLIVGAVAAGVVIVGATVAVVLMKRFKKKTDK